MPVTLTASEHDPTIFVIRVSGNWTWTDVQKLEDEPIALEARTKPDRIDFVIDLLDSPYLPHGSLAAGRNILSNPLPTSGLTVVLTANRLFIAMIDTFRRVFPKWGADIFVTNTMEEAVAFIHERRRTAPLP